jgi:hypothetical protein
MAGAGTYRQRHQKKMIVIGKNPLTKMAVSDLQSMVGASGMKDHES